MGADRNQCRGHRRWTRSFRWLRDNPLVHVGVADSCDTCGPQALEVAVRPNPRLLLTGALARRSRASRFCFWSGRGARRADSVWGRAAAPDAPAAEAQGVRWPPPVPPLASVLPSFRIND